MTVQVDTEELGKERAELLWNYRRRETAVRGDDGGCGDIVVELPSHTHTRSSSADPINSPPQRVELEWEDLADIENYYDDDRRGMHGFGQHRLGG